MSQFSEPRELVLQLALVEGMKVADFGAGSGHYTRVAAGAVGERGKVYAIDIQEDVLKHLKLNTHEMHHGTIETVWGDIERAGGTHLRDHSLDAAIVANVLFQCEDRAAVVREVARVLKLGGRVLLVDWSEPRGGMGPHHSHRISRKEAEKLFSDAGFQLEKNLDAGPHHWGVILKKI